MQGKWRLGGIYKLKIGWKWLQGIEWGILCKN